MDLMAWGMFVLAAAGAWAIVMYLYRRRETPGRGRTLLAGLRWAVLCLLALLVLDPHLPISGTASDGPDSYVLLDASLSMGLSTAAADSATLWDRAVAEAEALADDGPVLLFGESPRLVTLDSLERIEPYATSSRLLPALRTAAEAGADRVTVFTDGRIEDAEIAARALSSFGLDVELRPVGEGTNRSANRTLVEVAAPSWAEVGDSIRVRVGIAAAGREGDSLTVRIERDGDVIARTTVATPAPGRIAATTLSFQGGVASGGSDDSEAGLVRYDVAVEAGDAVPDDDHRSVYVRISERPAGVALVSFRPGWEPRFLAPALAQSLAVPVYGFIQVDDGRFIELGAGSEAGSEVSPDEVRRAAERADMVVLHGLSTAVPGWAAELASDAGRVLIFPVPEASALDLPVEFGGRMAGEWYVSGSVPASPVAALLAGIPLENLPPLVDPLSIEDAGRAWSPLSLRVNGRGEPAPLLAAGTTDARRWAVALARGYWRWAFRGGSAERAYQRLWSAVAGWLMERQGGAAVAAVRPENRVVLRGASIRWIAPGLPADSVALTIRREDGAAVTDTVLAMAGRDTLETDALPPGHYRYTARAFNGGESIAVASGPFTVESYAHEFSRPRVALAELEADSRRAEKSAPAPVKAAGTPLHATPWPYIILLGLLCTEWALRRRWGLR